MAKGKHRPAPGAIRPDKVLHPQSRKVAKMHKKENRKFKVTNSMSVGAKRLEILGEKLQVDLCAREIASNQVLGEAVQIANKTMTPRWRNTFLFRSSQQLPHLRLGPLKGLLS